MNNYLHIFLKLFFIYIFCFVFVFILFFYAKILAMDVSLEKRLPEGTFDLWITPTNEANGPFLILSASNPISHRINLSIFIMI